MTLPAQVEEQGRLADEALAAGQPPGQEQQSVEEKGADTVEGLQAKVTDLEDKLKKSEHKYSVLQGKYKAEIEPIKDDVNSLKDLKHKVKILEEQNTGFQRKVADLVTSNAQFVRQNEELQSQLASKNAGTQGGDDLDVSNLLSEEDRKTLEDEGIEGPAIDVITKLIGKLAPKNKPGTTTSSDGQPSDAQKSVAQDFWMGIDESIKDWRVVNKMPEFINWLAQMAPYHNNKTRHDILNEATENYDLNTVVSLFNDFKASDSYKPEQVASSTEQTPPQDHSNDSPPEDPLEKEVEPNRSMDADIQINPNLGNPNDPARMLAPEYKFTTTEITAFYKDATQSGGLYRTNRELYDKIDSAIVKAGAEGRVVNA